MAEDAAPASDDAPPKKSGKKPLLFGVVAALILGGATAYTTMSGMVSVPFLSGEAKEEKPPEKGHSVRYEEDYAYVAVDELFVSLVKQGRPKQLRMSLNIETDKENVEAVKKAMPRIRDMLNTYLRAVEEEDLTDPAAMDRLRAQILRRMRLVLPPEAVSDLLVTSFIIT